MRTPSPSALTAARIPKITDLRDQLCYGDTTLVRCTSFVDDLRVFRKRYSAMGARGTDLFEWKSSEDQAALKQMTAAFLDEYGFGELYWPSDPSARNFNSLQYSKDRLFIHRVLRQLIFKLNLQQYRNNKYKKKEQQQPDSKDNIVIDLEDEEPPTNVLPRSRFPKAGAHASGGDFPQSHTEIPPNSSNKNAATTNTSISSTNNSRVFTAPNSFQEDISQLDVFQEDDDFFPPRPETELEARATKRKLRAPGNTNPVKRSKATSDHNQSSPRHRRTTQHPDYPHIQDIDHASASQTTRARSTSGYDDSRASPQTRIRQGSEHIEDVLHYIRTNRPSVTSEGAPPSPGTRQRESTHDSRIDPNLEQIVAQPSATQPRPSDHSFPNSSSSRDPINQNLLLHAHTKPDPPPISENVRQVYEQILLRREKQAATPPKSNINFSYIIILSRKPVYQYKSWKPKGHFLEKSLAELMNELPFDNKDDVTGLTFRLKGPGVAVEETLACDEDTNYESTKGRFLETVKMCLKSHTKANPGKPLGMSFEIEAVKDDGEEEEDDFDNDLVF